MIRRTLVLAAAATGLALAAASSALAAQPYPVNYKTFDLTQGTRDHLVYANGALTLASTGLVSTPYTDPYANVNGDGVDGSGTYLSGSWTSPDVSLNFGFNELVSSWNATTPTGTWVQSEIQPKLDDGHWGKWYILGRWTSGDSDFHRTSVGGQGDADGFVSIDTFFTKDHPAVAYRLRLTLFRRTTTAASPSVSRYGAVASNYTNQKGSFPSPSTMKKKIVLDVPKYSQEIHHGEYPQYDNGGEAWCSPTSTAMVVAYWDQRFPGRGYQPSPAETAWVNPAYADPVVDFTARAVYDYHYNGAGNWPFNTAYAASRGLVADVTQLHSLAEAEPFIRAGIPLVASINFTSNKLPGASIKSTDGHLVVIVGFSADGSTVYVNDPASPDDASVVHTYGREAFERAWIDGSGGIVYVDRPADVATPSLTANNS
jgi:hypothetical protein